MVLQHVVCKLLDEKDSTLAFAISKTNGSFRMENKAGGYRVLFSKMGYEAAYKKIETGIDEYNIQLNEKAVTLQEVLVVTPPITKNKDTLKYNVNAFREKGDLYIEDVIKKLPGITVSGSGQIMYLGKNINKLNIEGVDLMGNNYNQATKNMPAEAVSQIQIIENNQPIRALEDKVHNDKATLNIKLNKNFKVKPFGEVMGMAGIYPMRWDTHSNVFKISSKNQLFASFDTNNQGEEYSAFSNALSNNDIYLYEPPPSYVLYGSQLRTPPLSALYYLQNKSAYATINYLHAFTQTSTIKFNLLYHHNKVLNTDSTYRRIEGGKETVLYDINRLTDNQNTLKGELHYELNNKGIYVKESLTSEFVHHHTDNNNRTNVGLIREDDLQQTQHLQNSLSMMMNGEKRLIQFSSVLRYHQNKEKLRLPHIQLKQHNRTNEFFTRNRLGTSFNLAGNPLIVAYIIENKHTNFELDTDTLLNHSTQYWLHTLEPVYEIALPRGGMDIHAPIEYLLYNYTWKAITRKRLLFSPAVNFHHKIGNYYNMTVNAGYNMNANTTELPIGKVLFRNYRTLSTSFDSLSVNRMSAISSTLSYLNTSTMFSWSVYAGWTKTDFDSYMAYTYFPNFTYIQPRWGKNTQTAFTFSYNLMKVFRNANLTLKHKGSFVNKSTFIAQNNINDNVCYHVASGSLSANWNKLKWLHTYFVIEGNVYRKGRNKFSNTPATIKNFYCTLRSDVFPRNNMKWFVDLSQVTNGIADTRYLTVFFINSGVSYNLNKRVSLEFSALNLLNNKRYAEATYTGADYLYYEVPLRGREITIGGRISF